MIVIIMIMILYLNLFIERLLVHILKEKAVNGPAHILDHF